ncbi:MAG: hypothetical protein VKQ33_01425 [Candidatus Sericytochromatia bacterium]|nr:hypothetical protein [Candidatus Sericytochromatia bacterium]
MMRDNHRAPWAGRSFTLALALLAAACQTPAPAPLEGGKGNVGNRVGGAASGDVVGTAPDGQADLARNLGLVPPTSALGGDQFQLQDGSGRPLVGATVLVGNARLTTDAQGVVSLPPGVAASTQSPARLLAPGFVAQDVEIVPGQAFKMTAVDPARVPISAQAGGVASNATGNMTVVFPPGTLSGDAAVAVTRLYGQDGLPGQRLPEEMPFRVSANKDAQNPVSLADSGYKLADNLPLGTYHYALDLGEGVTIAPGASFIVKFKAEGRMAQLLQARHENGDSFTETPESITRDENGDFWLAMRVDGPKALTGVTPPRQRRLMAVACDTHNDVQANTFQVKKQWTTVIPGIEVPIWQGGHRTRNDVSANWVNSYASNSGGGCVSDWTARQYEHNNWRMQAGSSIPGWITLVTHNPAVNGGRCIYYQFDPNQYYCSGGRIYVKDPGYEWQTTYTTWVSKSISALVTWLSDDPRVTGPVSGARVSFNHALSALRSAPLGVDTGADGHASTLGLENSNGSASAVLPAQAAFTFSTPQSYTVNCQTVNLRVVKNMPRVTLQTTVRGTPSVGNVTLRTNLGDFPETPLSQGVVKPSLPLTSASGAFKVGGEYQPSASEWIEMASDSVNVTWNGAHTLPTSVWVSRPVRASLVYRSNDASLNADQRPTTLWGGKTPEGYRITFAHEQSGYANKTRLEPLVFTGVSSASTWGISGATSTVSATRTTNGVSLSGSKTGVVNDNTLQVAVNANLPALNFSFEGLLKNAWSMTYEVVGDDGAARTRTTRLDFGEVGVMGLSFAVPVEDALHNAGKHTFRLINMISEDGNDRLLMPDTRSNEPFPAVAGLHRGGTFSYPVVLQATFIAPK